MDLRFCILERRGRGGRGQCGCGCSLVHLEGSAVGEAATGFLCSGRVLRTFCAEIARKHEKNRVSEKPQIRPPVETLVRGL